MNARLKYLINGAKSNLDIFVVNDVTEYHSFPIHRQVEQKGFKTIYEPDGSWSGLALWGAVLPGVFYLNFPIGFDEYKQILGVVNSEFGEEIKKKGSKTIFWDDLLHTYLDKHSVEEVSSELQEHDLAGVYKKALSDGKMISSRIHNLREDQEHVNELLKGTGLDLLSTRTQDVLFTYAVDKFHPRFSLSGEIMFDICESDLIPNQGGIYNAPGTSLHFRDYSSARKIVHRKILELVEEKCAALNDENPPKLEITIPYVVVLDDVTNPLALKELQKEREPLSRMISEPFVSESGLKSEINRVVNRYLDNLPEIKLKTHLVYAGVEQLKKHKKRLESLGTRFWPDFDSNPDSKYREFLKHFLDGDLVYVMRNEELIPIEETQFTFDKNGMLYNSGEPEIPLLVH